MGCTISITVDDLKKLDACPNGVTIFAKQFPDGMVGTWDRTAQLLLMASPLRPYFGWACDVGLLPRFNLRGSNLRGSNLRGSNLSGSNLRGSNLSGSDLRGSNLSYSDLSGSDLSGSDLRGSNLSYSDLSYSDLSGSNLSYSDLSYSDLSGSNLRGSNLSYSNLSGSFNISLADLTNAYRFIDDAVIQGWTVVDGRLQRAEVTASVTT